MEVILTQDVEHLGFANEKVKVKAGYGRNYLIPKGYAVLATKSNVKNLDEKLRQQARKIEQAKAEMEALAEKLQATKSKVGTKVGENGKIFGSITTLMLADAVKTQLGIELDRKKVEIPKDIEGPGTYSAKVTLSRDVAFDMEFEVVKEA